VSADLVHINGRAKLLALEARQTCVEQFVFIMTQPLRTGFFGRLRWLFFGVPTSGNLDGL
jgi:hypothetical protein